jgi:hypothetical protein
MERRGSGVAICRILESLKMGKALKKNMMFMLVRVRRDRASFGESGSSGRIFICRCRWEIFPRVRR